MKVALDLVRDIDRDETGLIEIRLPLCNYFLYYRYIQWAHQFGMKIHLPIDTRYLSYCQEYCDYCYRKGMPLFIISNQFHLVLSNPIWLNAFFEKNVIFSSQISILFICLGLLSLLNSQNSNREIWGEWDGCGTISPELLMKIANKQFSIIRREKILKTSSIFSNQFVLICTV